MTLSKANSRLSQYLLRQSNKTDVVEINQTQSQSLNKNYKPQKSLHCNSCGTTHFGTCPPKCPACSKKHYQSHFGKGCKSKNYVHLVKENDVNMSELEVFEVEKNVLNKNVTNWYLDSGVKLSPY